MCANSIFFNELHILSVCDIWYFFTKWQKMDKCNITIAVVFNSWSSMNSVKT